jgi:agmatine deiminase
MSETIAPLDISLVSPRLAQLQLLPEWSPCRAVLLAWPYPGSDWDETLDEVSDCYWRLLGALLSDVASPVHAWVLLHPSMDSRAWQREFNAKGLPGEQLKLLTNVPYDDTWIRDYGPLSLGKDNRCTEYLDFAFNGWGGKYPAEADDSVSSRLASALEQTPVRQEWVVEGGALEVNGAGVLLANKDCVVDSRRNASLNEQQVIRLLQDQLGVNTIEWLEGICLTGDDTDGHVDTIARFAAEDCIVYAGRNDAHPDSEVLERLHRQIAGICQRHGWRQMELPSPLVHSRVDNRLLPATYTNFLIVNQRVLTPVYGVPEDNQALAVLQHAFPTFTIVPVDCAALVEQHGSLHCATMQVAQQQVRV